MRKLAYLLTFVLLAISGTAWAQTTIAVNNAGTTGTTINMLAKLTGAPSTAVITATTDIDNIEGVVVGWANPTAGSATATTGQALIVKVGEANCTFDATAVTAGDYVINSATTAGACHDAGSTRPTATQVIGRALASGSASTTQLVSVQSGFTGTGSSGVTSVSPGAGVATSNVGGQTAITTTGTLYANASYFPKFLGGLGVSNDGTSPNTVFDVAAGTVTSDDYTVMMKLAAFTKTLSSWALGSGNGCLDTGAVASATWYHVFLIERTDTGVVDVLCSLSAASPTFPASYTKKARIWSIFTCDTIWCASASTNISQFTQRGAIYWPKNLQTSVAPDINTTTLPTTSILFALAHVPPGVAVQPICRYTIANTGNSVILTSPDEADVAPTTATPFGATGSPGWDQLDTTLTSGDQNSTCPLLTTNTNQQIRARGSATNTTLQLVVRGFVD